MKKFTKKIILLIATILPMIADAQYYTVYKTNGETVRYSHSEVDSIVFTEKVPQDAHEAVDLGLSVKWASCNVGANKPEEYGSYYAWGETSERLYTTRAQYAYYDSKTDTYTNIGSNISGTGYDVARAKWGGNWRMPTRAEMEELVNKCTWTWTTHNGVKGQLVTGPNGNSIFLPDAGDRLDELLDDGDESLGRPLLVIYRVGGELLLLSIFLSGQETLCVERP